MFGIIAVDIKYAIRSLLKRPIFAVTAIATIAAAMAANTTVFAVLNAVVFRSRPVYKSAELVAMYGRQEDQPQSHLSISYPDYLTIRTESNTLSTVSAYSPLAAAMGRGESTEFVSGELVSQNYFQTLGIPMHIGREFEAGDAGQALVILSDGLWHRSFNGASDILGKTVEINSDRFTVIGVAPEKFSGMIRGVTASFWITTDAPAGISFNDRIAIQDRRVRMFWVVGRLAAGAGIGAAEANVREIGERIRRQHPENKNDRGFITIPLDSVAVHPDVDTVIYPAAYAVILVSVFVLMIACANLAGLTLSVAAGRSKDIATRVAIGAPRWRVIQPLLIESVMIAAAGGLAGLVLASAVVNALRSVPLPFPVPVVFDFAIDGRVLAFTAAMTIAAALMFGLAPAVQISNPSVSQVLNEESGFTAGGRARSRGRRLLVVAQVALSVVLLVLSGLTVRSMNNANHIDFGFRSGGLTVGSINLRVRNYSADRGRLFFRNLIAKLDGMPGIESAAITTHVPLSMSIELVRIASQSQQTIPENERPIADTAAVSMNYFKTMGIPILQGREFGERDASSAANVAVVNETLARQLWPGGSALGRKLLVGPPGSLTAEVIGVAKDGKYRTIGEATLPFVYLDLDQRYEPAVTCILRSSTLTNSAAAGAAALRTALRDLDPDAPLYGVQSIQDRMGIAIALPRYAAALFGTLALLGSALAAVGLHGVVAYSVSERTREIGIRMSLGSSPSASLWLVLKEGFTMTTFGTVIGLILAVFSAKFLSTILYGVTPSDPLTFTAASVLMIATTAFACWAPARRAARVDPAVTLRHQ